MDHQKQQLSSDSMYTGFPPISAKYPWLVAQNVDAEEEDGQFFYNLNDPLSKYQCRIAELFKKRIRGCFHGWVILSDHPYNNNLTFSLWNQNTSKIICFPPLILKDKDYGCIGECCLSAPPDDPSAILLLTRTNKSNFVFCRLHRKRKSVPWIEMSYDKQLKKITSMDGLLVSSLAYCNGKVYALNTGTCIATYFIKVDILVKDREVVIKLSLFGMCPYTSTYCDNWLHYLKGSSRELFYIKIGFHDKTQKTPGSVGLFKMDMTTIKREDTEIFKGLDRTNMNWEDMDDLSVDIVKTILMWKEMADLKNAVFFVDMSCNYSVCYSSTTASEFGGFIHIRGKLGEVIFSYHVKKKTISISSMPSWVLPSSLVSMWEYRLEDHEEARYAIDSKQDEEDKNSEIVVRSVTDQEVEFKESRLLNLPFPVLEMIMELCICVEYMNFRATCKLCHLAAPPKQNSHETELTRLQNYSLLSPWLVVANKNQGVLSFIDPLFGGSYFMKNVEVSFNSVKNYIEGEKILCSRFGWLLFYHKEFGHLVFFNPFTSELRKLPRADYNIETSCFSAPPTSPDCMVVGFKTLYDGWHVLIHFVGRRESSWHSLSSGPERLAVRFPTFIDRDLYALVNERELFVFKDLGGENFSWKLFETQIPRRCRKSSTKYYLMTCDQHLLLVVVGEFGELVEIFKRNDAKEEWEKIDSLGRHMIYIGGTTCICIEAKVPQMENKIYFPRLNSENGKIELYSLETCMYHTFTGKDIKENLKDFIGTYLHLNQHAWIEPNWS